MLWKLKIFKGLCVVTAPAQKNEIVITVMLLVSGLFLAVSGAYAQTVDQPPPVRSAIDENGVNLINGSINASGAPIAIGVPGQGGLIRYQYVGWNGTALFNRDSLSGTINRDFAGVYTVSIGRQSLSYSLSGTTYTSLQGDGSTLTKTNATTYTLVLRDGTTAVFSTTFFNQVTANVALITSLSQPNGEVETYTYSLAQYRVFPSGALATAYRIESVTNNFGYQIKYLYRTTGAVTFSDSTLSQVIAINNAVEYCAPAATSCSLTGNWPSVSFSTTTANLVTDNLGRQTTFPTVASASATTVWVRPSGKTITFVTDASSRVTSVSNGTGTWQYAYFDSGTTRTTTVTDPLGHTRVVVSDTGAALVASDTDGLSHKTTYSYDSVGRLKKIVRPEGAPFQVVRPGTDSTSFTYDARGNITQTVVTGQDGVSTVTTSASYDTTCTAAPKCNQPNWTRDANGNQTDYTYSTTTGQVTSVIRPAGANGLRPQTDYTYTNLYAWYKNSAGAIVQAATPISLPTKVSQCTNAQTCGGSASAVQTVTTYGSSGVANNLLPRQITQGSGDGTLAASTLLSYDAVGNRLTQTDPLGNVTRYRYDVGRQIVGVVGPDPDGGGTLRNRAVRLTYRCDATVKSGCAGLVTLSEQGTVASQLDSDWAGFSALGQTATKYDTIERKTLETVANGSTYIRVTQSSYDAANRPTCTALRMNPAAIGSLPTSACTLGTAGSAGPDRITAYSFDNADRLLKTTRGYGTTVVADEVAYTYGDDNEVATQTDGKGNKTTIVRDTFNRTSRVQFPTPSNGGVSSTTDYEQYSYDNNSNVTQNRRRDGTLVNTAYDALNLPTSGYNGATYGYDNLGRLTSASVGGQSWSFGYNALSQPTSESSPLGSVTRQYYLDGQRKQLTYPDGYFVTYAYDATRALTSISDSSSVTLMSMGYDNLGRPTSITRAQGATESRTYGSDLRLSALSFAFGDTAKNVTFNYTYNLAGQPISNTPSNTLYRWASSRAAAGYTSDGQNKYTTVGLNNLTYDGRANTTSTGMANFAYDGLNRMTSAPSTTMSYDAIGRLNQVAGSTTTRFLNDGQQIIAEYNSAGTLQRRFVPGPGLDRPLIWFEGAATASSNARWLLANAFGSIVAVGNSGGASNTTLGINTYDEFGLGAVGNIGRFQYKGMAYLPETGLYHSRARTYSQYLGRFLQPDPAGYAGSGMNLYGFVGNSPINRSDPTGLFGSNCQYTACPPDDVPTLPEIEVPGTRPPPEPNYTPDIPFIPPSVDPGGVPSLGPIQSRADAAQQYAKDFLCAKSEEDAGAALLDLVSNAGDAAEFAGKSPLLAISATLAGAGTAFPQATSFFGAAAARGLQRLGQVGRASGGLLILGNLAASRYQDAIYSGIDFAVYNSLSTVGVDGALFTGGFTLAVTGATGLLYYSAGGSKGLVQGALCH